MSTVKSGEIYWAKDVSTVNCCGEAVQKNRPVIVINNRQGLKFSGITAVLNGAAVQPNGEVTVTFNIPDGFGKDVAIFFVTDDGTYEKLESEVNEDGKTITAKLNHFSNYAVCKLGTSNSVNTDVTSEPTEQPTESNNTLWIIFAIVAVVLIAGAVVTVIIVKKNNAID